MSATTSAHSGESHALGPRTTADGDPRDARWDAGWDRTWTAMPYVALGLTAGVALVRTASPWDSRLGVLGLVVVATGWHWWWVTRHPAWPERHTFAMGGYFMGLLALVAVGIQLDSAMLALLYACFAISFVVLPRGWAYVGVAATALTLPVVLGLDGDHAPWTVRLTVFVTSVVLASGIGFAIRRIEQEAARRSRTARDLRVLMDRNAILAGKIAERERAAGASAERERLARAIHDTLAQALAGISAQLEAAEDVLTPSHPARARIVTARDQAREGLREARRSVESLRPSVLEDADLPTALGELTDRWKEQHDTPAQLVVTGRSVTLPAEREDALVRALGEALSNVSRHARATTVAVSLSYTATGAILDVGDDGVGFRPGSVPRTSFGLEAMRQWVVQAGGTLDVESTPHEGTTVTVSMPAATETGGPAR